MKSNVRLWVDDQRPAPEGWLHARTYEDAVHWIQHFGSRLEEISLDHDLNAAHHVGDYSDRTTGYDVLEYLLNAGLRPVIRIHTMNAEGVQRMTDLLESGDWF
jgi:hypothetical protein